jgi:UPF0755 protein
VFPPSATWQLFTRIIAIFIIVTVISSTFLAVTISYVSLPGPLKEAKTLIFSRGITLRNICNILAQEQAIKHEKFFWLILSLINKIEKIKAGEYAFTTAITPRQIIDILINGRSILHSITIPEGYTVKQIIDKIDCDPILHGDINSNIPEGSLLPDTYFFSYGDKKQAILSRMKKKMQLTLNELWEKKAPNLPYKNKEEALILASIVEKEAANYAEKKKIAAVFINRLNKGMKLQADPTTIYAITEGKYNLQRELTKRDLQIKSDYNTYFVKGLPPTPISNPGKASIEAVLNPAVSKDIFFVLDRDGVHRFSDNLATHNQHVYNYRNNVKVNP